MIVSNKSRNIADTRPAADPTDAAPTGGLDQHLELLLEDLGFRPLSARSLLLSYLLGSHPPELDVAHLVAFGERVGLRPGTVRTALSRMVAAGEATVEEGRYRLAGRMLERQRQQHAGLVAPVRTWNGDWWAAIVVGTDRSVRERREFRNVMVGGRMGELRPELWMRPANVAEPPARADVVMTCGPLVSGDPKELAMRLWDTAAIEETAVRLDRAITDLDRALNDARDDADRLLPLAFDVAAACVRFLRTEPQLPASLVPMPASHELRTTYRTFNRRFQHHLRTWIEPVIRPRVR